MITPKDKNYDEYIEEFGLYGMKLGQLIEAL